MKEMDILGVNRFETYSNLSCDMGMHHAGISYNSYGTCEFRLFNSTLDYKLVLKHEDIVLNNEVEYTYSVRAPSSPILHSRRPAESYPVEDDTKSDPAKRVSLVTFPNKSYILNVVMPLRVVVTGRPSASYE